MPRRVVNIVTYNEEEWLRPNLKEIYPLADQIVVTEGGIRGWAPTPRSADSTYEIIKQLDTEHKVVMATKPHDFWDSFEECFDARTRHLVDGDLLLILNSDEFVCREDALAAFDYLESHPEYDEIIPLFLHFWRDFHHILKPKRRVVNITHQRLIRFRMGYHWSCHHPTACDFWHRDTVWLEPYDSRRYLTPYWYIYHFNYLSDPERFKEKLLFCIKSGVHGNIFDGNMAFAREQVDQCNRFSFKEDQGEVLDFDGTLPESLLFHPLSGYREPFFKDIRHTHWLSTPEYGEGQVGRIYDRGY